MITVTYKASVTRDEPRSSIGVDMYDRVTLISPKTGKQITICGSFDGDNCMDIRNQAALATNFGKYPSAKISLTTEDLHRWLDAYNRMVEHFDARS